MFTHPPSSTPGCQECKVQVGQKFFTLHCFIFVLGRNVNRGGMSRVSPYFKMASQTQRKHIKPVLENSSKELIAVKYRSIKTKASNAVFRIRIRSEPYHLALDSDPGSKQKL